MKTTALPLGCIIIGTILIFMGIWSIFPPKIIDHVKHRMDEQFFWLNVPIAIMLLIIIGITFWTGGISAAKAGVDATVATTSAFGLMLVILMPVMGFSVPVFKHFETIIIRALEGPLGYGWAFLTAFVVPGGNTMSNIVKSIWTEKPNLRPVVLYCLTMTPLIGWTIYFVRSLGLGREISREMYRINWYAAMWLTPFFMIWAKFFFKPK